MKKTVLIVGGVAGGASAAARLRRLDEDVNIIMFERGEYISFANCGLPYYIGGEITEKSALTLQTPKTFNKRFNVDVRVFCEIESIDKEKKIVSVKNTLTGETYIEKYDSLILSMGAQPIKPNIEGIDSNKVFTLRNIPDTYKIKEYIQEKNIKSAAVVGGGYIGIEMAENLKKAGLDVSVIEMQNQIIAPLDYEMAIDIKKYIEHQGVNVLLNNGVKAIKEEGKGLRITLENKEICADILLLAIGVKPESAIAKNAHLEVAQNGGIIVNDKMQTSDENIYAVGDAVQVDDFVTGEKTLMALAGPANKQGRIAADNICGINSKYKGSQGSAIIKVFDATVAATGINEKTAKKLNLNYDKSYTFSANHATYYPNAKNMSIKTIFEKETGRILGAQIIGFDGTDKRCDVIATAIRAKLTANDLTQLELCYAPPYSSAKDPVNMAGYVIDNIINGNVKTFHWHEIKDLQNKDVILLDTRTQKEYGQGSIEGFINIPLDDLRERYEELDKNKKVYLTCQIGLRGYIAARILMQKGFDVYNLSGGYRLYSTIFD